MNDVTTACREIHLEDASWLQLHYQSFIWAAYRA
jgi:hypothetical protein